ncbi:unnamed protein product [Trypanosoma congolense IL3000]|uniref:WGS project CAEQ00000000 data, annotated contig 890 n=1 Tax=Trypanosoma congolense (strain IL3000) TaxID=1068625 RepID=F9WJA0_TRYCI|nr:unnamed protein product [Trypanosoma congolense IL3000]
MAKRKVKQAGRKVATDAAGRSLASSKAAVARVNGTWTLDSLVKNVLMEGYGGLGDMSLHDFLMKHFKETFGVKNASLAVFVEDPTYYVADESVLGRITSSSPYMEFMRKYESHSTMRMGLYRLHNKGIYSLRQWADAADNVRNIGVQVRGKLNTALGSAGHTGGPRRNVDALGGELVEDAYDSVFYAAWGYVARSGECSKKWLWTGMSYLMPGEQPRLWSEAQADAPYDPEEPWEGDEVPGVCGKLVLAVLFSRGGWPHMLFDAEKAHRERVDSLTGHNNACDAYIRKENVRVWHIVKRRIDECFEGEGVVHPFLVIGTSGSGKSSAMGPFLLNRLLHYQSERLEAVVYFVKGEAYLFHREEKRVVHYRSQVCAVSRIKYMISIGVEGYIIFDIGEGSRGMEGLPRAWGIVLIASPDMKDFHEFKARQPCTLPIYINCYEDVEFKAVLAWEGRRQLSSNQINWNSVNLRNYWEVVRKRIHMVGPLPRYVLGSEECYRCRVIDVKAALSRALNGRAEHYAYLLSHPDKWHMDGTTNMMKLVRAQSGCPEEARNEAVCTYVRGRILEEAMEDFAKRELRRDVLVSFKKRCVSTLEASGLQAFMIGSVVTEVMRHLKYLPREGETERSRSSVLCRPAARGRVPTTFHSFSSADTPVEMVAECLYKPAEKNFPVVGGFFLVDAVGEGVSFPEGAEAPTQTIVLLQVTRARNQRTTTSKVRRLRERLAASFSNWREMESSLSYEIIYVQHANSAAIATRQRCDRSGTVSDLASERFWGGVDQFRVKLEAPIAKLLLQEIYDAKITEDVAAIVRDLRGVNITAVAGADSE